MNLAEAADLDKHLVPGLYDLVTHSFNLIDILLINFVPMVALDQVFELYGMQLIIDSSFQNLIEVEPAVEVEFAAD